MLEQEEVTLSAEKSFFHYFFFSLHFRGRGGREQRAESELVLGQLCWGSTEPQNGLIFFCWEAGARLQGRHSPPGVHCCCFRRRTTGRDAVLMFAGVHGSQLDAARRLVHHC